MKTPLLLIAFVHLGAGSLLPAQDRQHAAQPSPFGTWDETGVPFFGQTVDARKLGQPWPDDNLTPRGIVLNLGSGYHACFDPDLLRLALVWREQGPGDYLTMNGMAPGSYRQPHRKAPAGQDDLPRPLGTPVLANGLYAGWGVGTSADRRDPRRSSIDPGEPGLGPLPPELGRWVGLLVGGDVPAMVYEVGGTRIEERLRFRPDPGREASLLFRDLRIAAHEHPLTLFHSTGQEVSIAPASEEEYWTVPIWPMEGAVSFRAQRLEEPGQTFAPASREKRWRETVTLPIPPPSGTEDSFVADDVPLPLPNPWRRNVRPSDFDFFDDGRLALVTFDGDVWIADGVERTRPEIRWRRFASGLHEPMCLRIENGQVVIFDRNGLTRLQDRDGNGEADFHENICSIPAQTGETREFAMGLELKPGGGYYLAKGGQVAGTRGKLNGTIVEVSPDGRSYTVVATGLRQPFIGVDPATGILTASDQQGHWKPATPIHVVHPGDYYGFQPVRLGPDANRGRNIVEPPLWIPHFVNQSGARQVWLRGARMGPLNDCLIHLGYNRPALFKVFLDPDRSQGAVFPLMEDFPTGLLGGRVNPSDGLLYVGGLNLWGTVGKRVQGLFRIRPTGRASAIPRELRAFREGLLLRFDAALDPGMITQHANFTIDRWSYLRSHQYGSGHFKLDGTPGQESLPISSAYLSTDRRAVFLGVPGMQPVHTLRVTYRLGTDQVASAYFTIHALEPADLPAMGFSASEVDLTPTRMNTGPDHPEPSAAAGRQVAETFGCLGCHSVDGSPKVAEEPDLVVGPSWKGLFGSRRDFTDGTFVKQADEVYLRESILDPSRNTTRGFETGKTGVGMPSYLGVLQDHQVEAVILYIKSLK